MTNQQAFNKSANHLLKQRGRSVDHRLSNENVCAYRGTDGRMCAIGVLIPGGQYCHSMEGMAASDIHHRVDALDGVSPGLLQSLQLVHDDIHPNGWRGALRRLADMRGLSTRWVKGL